LSTAVAKLNEFQSNVVKVWEDKQKIQKLFAPTLTADEFDFFTSLGMGLGANPFTREIWAVKYTKDKPASIFLGRDFYRRKAEELENYNGHYADAVYSKDNFKVVNGTPEHSYNLADRGSLIGAYCLVHRKNVKFPFFIFVKFSEYNKGFSNWKIMPHTMIVKVAEAQALRGAFQGIFKGTYDESEIAVYDESLKVEQAPQQAVEDLNRDLGVNVPSEEEKPAESVSEPKKQDSNKITPAQRKRMFAIMKETGKTEDDLKQIINDLGYSSTKEILKPDYDEIIEALEVKADDKVESGKPLNLFE